MRWFVQHSAIKYRQGGAVPKINIDGQAYPALAAS